MTALPLQSHSLRDFVLRAKQLDREQNPDLSRFVLCGLWKEDGDLHQAVIDVTGNKIGEQSDLEVQRDYDSVLGFHDDLLIDSDLQVHPIAPPDHRLTTTIHMSREIPGVSTSS